MLPPVGFLVTRRICMRLQEADRRAVLYGRDTGVVLETADGGYAGAVQESNAEERYRLTARDNGPALPRRPRGLVIRRWSGWIVRRLAVGSIRKHQVRKPTDAEFYLAHRRTRQAAPALRSEASAENEAGDNR